MTGFWLELADDARAALDEVCRLTGLDRTQAVNAALPAYRHLHHAFTALAPVPPGPCPAHHDGFAFTDKPRTFLCGLRSGHTGQHECTDPDGSYSRWTAP